MGIEQQTAMPPEAEPGSSVSDIRRRAGAIAVARIFPEVPAESHHILPPTVIESHPPMRASEHDPFIDGAHLPPPDLFERVAA